MSKKMFTVAIQRIPWSNALGIAIFEDRGGKMYMARNVELVFEEMPEYALIEKPTLELPGMIAEPFLKAIAEALDEHGVKTDSDAKIAGTLQATRGWLEDMRALVFKTSPSTESTGTVERHGEG